MVEFLLTLSSCSLCSLGWGRGSSGIIELGEDSQTVLSAGVSMQVTGGADCLSLVWLDGSALMSSLHTLSVFVMTVTTPLGSVGQLCFSSLHTSMLSSPVSQLGEGTRPVMLWFTVSLSRVSLSTFSTNIT